MNLPSLVYVLDHEGRVIEANSAASRWRPSDDVEITGKTPHALLHSGCTSENCAFHRKWRELWHGMHSARRQSCELIDPVLHRRLRLRTERTDQDPDGAHAQRSQYGILRITDIGPSRHLPGGERRARLAGKGSGAALRVAAAVERERRRIAAELHDGISQQLAMMKLRIEGRLARGFGEGASPDAVELLHQVVDGLKGTLGEIRQINNSLMSVNSDRAGLVTQLRELCDSADRVRPGTRVTFASPLSDDDFLPARCGEYLPLAIYRITQEAVANALKHAGARTIRVSLFPSGGSRRTGELTLSIADDGCGFDAQAGRSVGVPGSGLGLTTMRQRALETGGEPALRSSAGDGTEVRVSWPMVLRAT